MPPPQKTSLVHWLGPEPRKRNKRRHADPGDSPGVLGEILATLEPSTHPHGSVIDALPRDIWLSAVGERIAAKSQPDKINADGVLMVRVSTSVWAQELSLLSTVILKRLEALGWRISYLRFFVGKLDQTVRMPARYEKRVVPPPVRLPEDLRCDLGKIEDVELRKAIAQAAASSFAANRAEQLLKMTPRQRILAAKDNNSSR